MPVGAFNTALIPTDLAEKSFSAMITRIMPNGSAPLFGLTALAKAETAKQIEHGFYSKTMLFPSVALSANIALGDTTLPVVSTANILPGMMLRADSSNENILVTAILSPTSISVQRAVGTVVAAAVLSGVNLWMVGNAYEEASLRPASLLIIPERVTNNTQIFRNTWAVSETTRATMLAAGDTAVAESRRDCAAFHAVDIEKALFFGQRFFGTRNNQPFHTMDGVINAVTQRVAGNITTLGSTTNYIQLEAALDPVFNQVTDPTSVGERMIFVGGFARRVLHQIFRANGTYFIEDGQTSWGLQFVSFKIPRGRFNIVEHPLFNAYGQSSSWAKMGIALDLNTFNVAYMEGRNTSSKEFNTNGNEASDNGVDAVGGTLTSELTSLVKNPAADAVLYNFTAGIKDA
jgi:hypothetical protein